MLPDGGQVLSPERSPSLASEARIVAQQSASEALIVAQSRRLSQAALMWELRRVTGHAMICLLFKSVAHD